MVSAALKSREACEQFVEADASDLLRATPETLVQALHSLLCPADAAVLTTDFANFVLHSVREGLGERRDGWVDDEDRIVAYENWAADLQGISTFRGGLSKPGPKRSTEQPAVVARADVAWYPNVARVFLRAFRHAFDLAR